MELVTEGRLHGDNPSEDGDPLERLAAESEPQTDNDELAASETEVESEAGEAPKPVDERDEPEPDPGAPKSQVREYVVLEEHTFEDDGSLYYSVLGKFQARNATNALRRAFKTLITDNEPHKLIAVTGTQWRITPVQRSHRQVESVQIG